MLHKNENLRSRFLNENEVANDKRAFSSRPWLAFCNVLIIISNKKIGQVRINNELTIKGLIHKRP